MNNKEKNFVSAVIYVHNAEEQIEAFLKMIIDVLDTNQGLNLVKCALKKIENKIAEYNGRFSITKGPDFTQIKCDNR